MTERPRRRRWLALLCVLLGMLFTGFGVWQVERLQWKRALIARVDARLAAPAVPAPPPAQWRSLRTEEFEYRRVTLSGVFDHGRSTRVDALTELGGGDWILTPMRTKQGTILVNRGFAPKNWRMPPEQAATATITGLMRVSEPGGRFLRPNRPTEGRWFSRDVPAIAAKRELSDVAPFFVDADATTNPSGFPRGGLTVVRFRNTHLLYALTWFALAALAFGGLALVIRDGQQKRDGHAFAGPDPTAP